MKRLLLIFAAVSLVAFSTWAATRLVGGAGFVHSQVVSSGACKLQQLRGFNNRATDVFIQVHETNAVPANGAAPVYSHLAFAGLSYSITFPGEGIDLAACTVVSSTASNTLTITTGPNNTDKVSILAILKN